MKNDLSITYNLFSEEMIGELLKVTRKGNSPTRVNFFNWQPELIASSNAIFFFELDEDLRNKVVNVLLEKQIISRKPKKISANVSLYSRHSYLTWHGDDNHKTSITCYLNKVWDKDWGGYFAYQEGETKENKFIVPQFNCCIKFDPPMWHSVLMTTSAAPMRESLQIFIDEYEDEN